MYTPDLLRLSLLVSSALLGAVLAAPTDAAPSEDASSPLITLPELIVVLRPALQARGEETPSPSEAVLNILQKYNAQIAPVFESINQTEARLRARDNSPLPDLSIYFKVDAPQTELETIAQALVTSNQVDGAYVRPAASLPEIKVKERMQTFVTRQSQTPNFRSRQGYLVPAPEGINAAYGNAVAGGKGEGISVVDCDQFWDFEHEDLAVKNGGVIVGPASGETKHGSAVVGIISGDENDYGVDGIAPNAMIYGASFEKATSSKIIQTAADHLSAGDVMLLELQSQGPNDKNWIAIEWYPDVFAAIQYAVAKGIIVVEAAGNGNQDLDAPIYEIPKQGFPSTWLNPFNMSNPSSGAVIVGAGAPTVGIHGRNDFGPVRSRLSFSNYGSRVDAQGWGYEVTTTGPGSLYNGGPHAVYNDAFSGTSSATPIVAGALISVQGILKQAGKKLTSQQARSILRSTGSPQQSGNNGPASQRIGNLPDLVQLIPAAQAIVV